MTVAVYQCPIHKSHQKVAVEVSHDLTLTQVNVLCPECNAIMERFDRT